MRCDDFGLRRPGCLPSGLLTAVATFSVIGGVVGYASDMVDFDLPDSLDDVDRWVAQRVLHPAATLHHEAMTRLAEDPSVTIQSPRISSSLLAAITSGSVEAGKIASRLGRPVSNVAVPPNRLVEAGFVVRHEDPVRARRPLYALADPFLQFHLSVLEPHGPLRRERRPREAWDARLRHVFDSSVRGPVFEEMARTWVRRWASTKTVASKDHVGPSSVSYDGKDWQLDVVCAGEGYVPGDRPVTALGQAKSGERLTATRLRGLERARAQLCGRAKGAKLLLFGPDVDGALRREASGRMDVELIDLERRYTGS
ncbi:MAG: MarR family winged helix-turn-helix transcriptional regulator [Actinomycetota bacterium]|nr:MarR family winged helix-turn-helix transcriptional regulator [Actinomycetota bacterium]